MGEICEHGVLKRSCYTCDLEEDKKDLYKVINELTEMVSDGGRISEFELRRDLKERYPHLF